MAALQTDSSQLRAASKSLFGDLVNVNFLIHSLVQQTTVLIAQLATTAGIRAPLAQIANQIFLDLAEELADQGVTRKVAADMFGMALRSYQAKVSRLQASMTDESRSLWEAVYAFVRQRKTVKQVELLNHFHSDPHESLKSILRDLVESGLVFSTGRGSETVYRLIGDDEFDQLYQQGTQESAKWTVWMLVYRQGAQTLPELQAQVQLSASILRIALSDLLDEGRIRIETDEDGTERYLSDGCYIPMDEEAGWEAAVFHHFNVIATSLSIKLRQMNLMTLPADVVGGSTYSMDIWDGHPMAEEALGLLRETRERASELNARLKAYNDAHDLPEDYRTVHFYCGQSVVD